MGSGIAGRGLLRATPSKELRDRNNETLLRTVHAKDGELVLAGDRGPRRDVRQQQRAFARLSDLAHDRTGLVDERGPVEERRPSAPLEVEHGTAGHETRRGLVEASEIDGDVKHDLRTR